MTSSKNKNPFGVKTNGFDCLNSPALAAFVARPQAEFQIGAMSREDTRQAPDCQ
jgi:hypothetical protein